MQNIQLLEPKVINKIAAGEVVERPASVVKELIENAIDAGASELYIELDNGGCNKITLVDNGSGVSPKDCKIILERHATSKIIEAEDIFDLSSMGFRGEALSAISSVSRFSLRTRRPEDSIGTEVIMNEQGLEIRPWKGPSGTSITVADLFYNIPVRAKFLKSKETEYAHCYEWIQSLALSHPDIRFSIHHNGKEKHIWPACKTNSTEDLLGEETLRQRLGFINTTINVEELIYATNKNEYGSWEALLSPPGIDKATSKQIINFVNGRWVKDKILLFGVMRGYHSHLMKGRYPIVLSFFHCDPALIDVNVHPAKTEIRFQYVAEVQALISQGIRLKLRDAEWASPPQNQHEKNPLPLSFKQRLFTVNKRSNDNVDLKEKNASIEKEDFDNIGYSNLKAHVSIPKVNYSTDSTKQGDPINLEQNIGSIPDKKVKYENEKTSEIPWEDLKYVGAYAKCYLMFEYEKNLLIIDQHAFHERILYERLLSRKELQEESQRLIIPEELCLDPILVSALRDNSKLIKKAGFSIEWLNEKSLEIKGVPVLLINKSITKVLESFADKLIHNSLKAQEELYHDIIATMACHSAVRAGEEFTSDELKLLLKEAETVDFFHNCPHGRRVFRWFSESQFSGFFDR